MKNLGKVDVIVTGMGAINALGQGITRFNSALLAGQCGISDCIRYPELSFLSAAAELKEFDFHQALLPYSHLPSPLLSAIHKVGRRAPLSIQASLIVALEAWVDAHLHERTKDNRRIGLVIAGQNTTQAYHYDLQASLQNNLHYLSPSYALQFMDTHHVGVLSEVFDIQGEGFTVGGASASGNVALIHGYRLILQDIVDICLVVGALADLSPLEIQGFYNIGALSGLSPFHKEPKKICRPFDRDHSGFVWGQGSGCIILESRDSLKEQIPSYGIMAGAAMNLDGTHTSTPNQDGERRAMAEALKNASLLPKDIRYINAHGSSSPIGDKTEVAAISNLFEEHLGKIWINSTKSLIGHCLWSAGILEAIATLLQMKQEFVHPNLNLDNPIDIASRFVGQQRETVTIDAAMSNSFGFGGINSSIIFTQPSTDFQDSGMVEPKGVKRARTSE